MQSIIIAGKNKKERDQKVKEILDSFSISALDITMITSGEKATIGIAQVRTVIETLYLAPLQGTTKAIVIDDGDLLTHEAQNALLKALEEPPAHTLMVLTASNDAVFLPTILSRCFVVKTNVSSSDPNEQALQEIHEDISLLFLGKIGDKLHLAQKVTKEKITALQWIEQVTIILSKELRMLLKAKKPEGTALSRYTKAFLALQSAHTILKTTNANPRLTIEHLLLQTKDSK